MAQFGLRDADLVIRQLPDGGVTIQPAVVMTRAEADAAMGRVFASPKAGSTRKGKLRTDPD